MAAPPAPLTGHKASNFASAFLFLPPDRRRGLAAVYAFARTVDDLVDHPGADPVEAARALDGWRSVLSNPSSSLGPGVDPVVWSALRETMGHHGVPAAPLLGLVDGVAMDLSPRRYESFDQLSVYCRGVASTVGLACLPLMGLPDEPACRAFAEDLGVAVQLTNILRDVKTDLARDRVYLPRADMARFSYAEEDLRAGVDDGRFAALMAFEADRARDHYRRAWAALPAGLRRAARPAVAMGRLYRGLLDELGRRRFNVFAGRVSLPLWRKAWAVGGAALGLGF